MILHTSMVKIFEDVSNKAVKSYGIEYIFGDNYTDREVKKLNVVCDTITYREHTKASTGFYPVGMEYVDYGIGGRYHNITFYNIPLQCVKQAADKIARVLNTTCICPYNVA